MTRVLVTGGKGFTDRDFLVAELTNLHFQWIFTELVYSERQRVGTLAGIWAQVWNVPVHVFPAGDLSKGYHAIYRHNWKMIREGNPHLVVAFPGGAGTLQLIDVALRFKIRVLAVGSWVEKGNRTRYRRR